MDMEALRIVTIDRFIPIYKFDLIKFENGLDPQWVCMYASIDEIQLPAYSMLRTIDKHHVLPIKIIRRVAVEDTTVSRRNRMKERVLVRG